MDRQTDAQTEKLTNTTGHPIHTMGCKTTAQSID